MSRGGGGECGLHYRRDEVERLPRELWGNSSAQRVKCHGALRAGDVDALVGRHDAIDTGLAQLVDRCGRVERARREARVDLPLRVLLRVVKQMRAELRPRAVGIVGDEDV